MSRVQLLYTRRHAISTPILRAAAWSPWSHVALCTGEGSVIEAVAFDGVRETRLEYALALASRYEFGWLPCARPAAAVEAARSQIGKPYDWLGVVGIGLHRDWREEDRWFCSEIIAWAIEQGGTVLFRSGHAGRVTQQHLYMLAPAEALS